MHAPCTSLPRRADGHALRPRLLACRSGEEPLTSTSPPSPDESAATPPAAGQAAAAPATPAGAGATSASAATGHAATPPTTPSPGARGDDDDELHPLGLEFWLKQVLTIAAVALGVWLAARVGSAQAAQFTAREEVDHAQRALAVVRAELEANLAEVRAARDKLRAGRTPGLEVSTDLLEAAAALPCMSRVDPLVLVEVERLFTHPFPDARAVLLEARPPPELKARAATVFTELLERADREVLPRLAAQQAELDALRARLDGEAAR